MRLLEFAPPVTNEQMRDYWNRSARECGVELLLTEACTESPTEHAIVGGHGSKIGDNYKVASFPIQAFLRTGILCAQPDDMEWFTQAFMQSLEMAISYGFTIEAAAGTDTWTNGPGVTVQAQAGTTTPTITQRVDAIKAGRRLWYKTVITETGIPVMHVPPSLAPDLKFNGVLQDDNKNIWGDPVVIAPGYDEHPNVFFTGPIEIKLGKLMRDNVPVPRMNNQTMVADVFAAIDVAPCSIVRIGAYV